VWGRVGRAQGAQQLGPGRTHTARTPPFTVGQSSCTVSSTTLFLACSLKAGPTVGMVCVCVCVCARADACVCACACVCVSKRGAPSHKHAGQRRRHVCARLWACGIRVRVRAAAAGPKRARGAARRSSLPSITPARPYPFADAVVQVDNGVVAVDEAGHPGLHVAQELVPVDLRVWRHRATMGKMRQMVMVVQGAVLGLFCGRAHNPTRAARALRAWCQAHGSQQSCPPVPVS